MTAYFVLLAAAGLAGIFGLVALIVAIVQACRSKWQAAVIWAGIMMFCVVGAIGTGVWVFVHGTRDAAAFITRKIAEEEANAAREAHEEALRRSPPLLEMTPEELRSGIDDEFWTYQGFRDWYRRPLRFPFSVNCIDELVKGSLCLNTRQGKSSDPNTDSTQVLSDITHYTFDAKLLLCRCEDAGKITWQLYNFDARTTTTFTSEADLLSAAQSAGFGGQLPMRTVKDQYDDYWK